eukprot:3622-Chlamydomonas_euryale.AAC.1
MDASDSSASTPSPTSSLVWRPVEVRRGTRAVWLVGLARLLYAVLLVLAAGAHSAVEVVSWTSVGARCTSPSAACGRSCVSLMHRWCHGRAKGHAAQAPLQP